ncbi:MAG: hypothetical protein M1818_004877 [Claussenomyces sp. TS43310]|nr:MAG: hypothetical protein M1818_004877 [Claussenomyces sp. TS43310]
MFPRDVHRRPLREQARANRDKILRNEATARKRKQSIDGEQEATELATKLWSKRRKIMNNGNLDSENSINNAFSSMDGQLLADYLAQRTKKFESDLSSVELEDKYIPAAVIKDTTSWEKLRTLDNLPAYLERFSSNPKKLWSASKKNGTPHTIIVTAAGLRAADIARVIRKFQAKDVTVAKLFAKHIKVKDAIKFLQSNRTGIAVGTPVRLDDLIEAGALAVDRLERLVLDCSHIDQKKRSICDIPEVFTPLMQWLNRREFKERYGSNSNSLELLCY